MNQIHVLETEIADLKSQLQLKEKELNHLKQKWTQYGEEQMVPNNNGQNDFGLSRATKIGGLPKWAIERYSRQILLPDIGVAGQERLCAARVLVVGAGGLGCPAAVYLAGAGVGTISIVDSDDVDVTNIHRQILHSEADQGVNKAMSAAASLAQLNSRIQVVPYTFRLDTARVLELVSRHQLVLDCTDNVATRYLLGDACAIAKVPLVSGSALKMEGQLSVYAYRAENNPNEQDPSLVGPCYRCVFPTPPPPETVGSCAAHGVAGPVPGAIGCLQALEAIKLIAGQTHDRLLVGRMLIFDGEDMTVRTVRLRPRNPQCAACGPEAKLHDLLDYGGYCTRDKEEDQELNLLPPEQRISAQELADTLKLSPSNLEEPSSRKHLVVDVRPEEEYRMCSLEGTVSCPIDSLHGDNLDDILDMIRRCSERVTFICRRGNDSQIAVTRVLGSLEAPHRGKVRDLAGGLHAWAKHVDRGFPVY